MRNVEAFESLQNGDGILLDPTRHWRGSVLMFYRPTIVRDFATAQGMTYPIWLDPDHQFSLKFLTVGVPETFVIDRAGVIRFRMIGAFRRGDTTLAAAVRRAMAS